MSCTTDFQNLCSRENGDVNICTPPPWCWTSCCSSGAVLLEVRLWVSSGLDYKRRDITRYKLILLVMWNHPGVLRKTDVHY